MTDGAPPIQGGDVAASLCAPASEPGPADAPANRVGIGRAFGGGLWVLLSESLLLPIGLVIAVYLTWRLKDTGYGLFALALAVVSWVEYSLTSTFARSTIRIVAEAVDWKPAAATALRAQLAIGLVAGAGLWMLAGAIAGLLGEPALAGHLRWLAWDVPLFGLAQAYRCVLIGTGRFAPRAVAGVGRAAGRLVFAVVLVEMGLSVRGAVLSCLGASAVEIVVCRLFLGDALLWRRGCRGTLARVVEAAGPLLVAAVSMRLLEKLDLLMLKGLGASVEMAGWYGAAQNLAMVPSVVGTAVSPVALWGVSGALRQGDPLLARRLAREVLRGALIAALLLAAVLAGAGRDMVGVLYPASFARAGGLVPWLVIATAATVLHAVTVSILFAAANPRWVIAVTLPVPVVATAAQLLLIPRFEEAGAAAGTLIAAVSGVTIALPFLWRILRTTVPPGTVLRAGAAAAAAYALAAAWPTRGIMVAAELAAALLVGGAILVLLGEFTAGERAAAAAWGRGLLRRTPREAA